jgi:Ni,Fe-hydrogenase maturation factor
METILIQITSSKTLKLLEDLEELKLLRVLKKKVQPEVELSKKYAGKLSPEVGEELKKSIEKSRKEWNRNI